MDADPAANPSPKLPAVARLSLAFSSLLLLGAFALGSVHSLQRSQQPPSIHLEPLLHGQTYFEAGELRAAVREFQVAAAILTTDPSPLLALATTFRELGETEQELAAAQEAVLRGPDDPRTQLALGTVLARRGDTEAATEALERSLELEPGNVDARVNLGIVELKARRPARALEHFNKALTADPTNGAARNAAEQARARLQRSGAMAPPR
jgi:Flp pilus assembly protein TadD